MTLIFIGYTQQDEAPPPQIQIICLPFLTAVLRHMDVIEESAKQVEAKKYLPLKVLAAEELESYFKTNHIAVRVCASLSELQNLRSIYLSNE